MSFYTRFADTEALVTSTTTTVLGSTDAVLVFSGTDKKYYQSTVRDVGGGQQGVGQAITTSTAAGFQAITALGGACTITAAATGGVAILPAPPFAGIIKLVSLSATSTTTGFQVISSSSNVAMFTTGTSSNTVVPRLQCLMAENSSAFMITSISTSAWQVTFQSASPGIVFSTTTAT